jgi:hypothetical protein
MIGDQWLEVLIGIAVALLLTLLVLIAVLVIRRPKGKLAAAYRRFSSSDALPGRNLRLKLLVLSVLVILNVVCLGLLLSRAPAEQAGEPTSSQSPTPGGQSSTPGRSTASEPRNDSPREATMQPQKETIQLEDVVPSARPFETVQVQGTYRGGAGAFLRLQRLEGGNWRDFPLPAKTDQSGRFTTYVELGQPGRHQLRVRDPDSGVTSKPFVVMIKG